MRRPRKNIYLDDKQLKRLRKQSDHDHVPVSELVRRAVDAFLAWDDPNYTPEHMPQTRKSHSSPS